MSDTDPINTFQREAFRLERLPSYEAADEARAFDEFRKYGSVSTEFNQEWIELIQQAKQRGAAVRRLRLVSEPLSEYERFELLAAYQVGIEVGEDIRVAVRDIDDLIPTKDYWLYDDAVIEWMKYSSAGVYLGSQASHITEADMPGLTATRQLFDRSPTVAQFCQARKLSPRHP